MEAKTRRATILVVALAVLALAAPASALGRCANAAKTPSEITLKQARTAVACLINQRRAKNGSGKLGWDRRLARAAQRHSHAMNKRKFYSHVSPGGATPAARVRKAGYLAGAAAWGIGENIDWGGGVHGTPKAVVGEWMRSTSHRQTLLSRSYKQLGIGFKRGTPFGRGARNAALFTVDFGYRRG